MQKFMEKVIDNSTEKIRNAFGSWRKFSKIHKIMQKFMKNVIHNSTEKIRNDFGSWRKFSKINRNVFIIEKKYLSSVF